MTTSAARPHRHLCPDADERDEIEDAEFWERVLGQSTPEPFEDDLEIDPQLAVEPCPVCGSSGACAYDAEGRALIHTTDDGEDS